MTPLRTLVIALALLTALAAPATPAPTAATPARVNGRPVVAITPAASRASRATSVTRRNVPADTSVHTRPRVAPRTLDDIHIEGEIPVPQVLFITAREQRRFMEFQHHRYQRSSLELGRATATPSRIVVTSPAPAERKENQR